MEKKIDAALEKTDIAILDKCEFSYSDFIMEHELKVLLKIF